MGVMKTLTINGATYSVVPIVPALSVTLLANGWVKEGDTYSQVVGVEGVTSHSKVDLQPTPEQLEEFHYKVLAFVAENDGGKVTVYAIGDKPSGDHTIQVTLTEVEGTGKIRGNTVGTTMPRSNLEQDDPTKADYVAGREEFADKVASLARHAAYVTAYGAKGDGSTDDTAAFQDALANERVVFVPGGTYKLSSGLVIGDNCCLELSQDTVLEFTNTIGNCITLGMSSTLKGNHATVNVPYEFSGNVVYAYSGDTTEADQSLMPPFSTWSPMWKSGRYVTDLNICKADYRGHHYAVNPDECKGTAVYLSATGTVGLLTYMWGIYFSGLRIAGAFSYGIHAVNLGKGWLNDMRIDAFIDACEIGVCLEDCSQAYISATIQPRRAYTEDKVYIPYAKHGIKLVRSKNVDMSGSRIWDWYNTDPSKLITLWTDGGEYQPYAMIGDCRGAIINDYCYNESGAPDIRDRIFTDTNSNLDTMTILQEPITRWFKVKNNDPYYSDGKTEKKLVTQTELDAHFDTDVVKNFTDVLATAIDTDGSIYNGIGYKMGVLVNANGSLAESAYYGTTGYIPCVKGSQIFAENLSFVAGDDGAKIILFDANFNYVFHVNRANLIKGNNYYVGYAETANGFGCTINNVPKLDNVAYARFTIYKTAWGNNPMMSVDEEIKYTVEGFLADGVKVKGENIVGVPGQDTPDWVAKKTESGGNVIVIPEQTISGGMWKNRQIDIQPDIDYEVYVNGQRYTCKAWGSGILGNNTSLTKNDYPFCVYWAGGSSTSGMFFSDSTISTPVTLKVTDAIVEVYNKMPEGYLPDGVAMLDDIPQGGGVDVTASVGQTILVEEVDSNGRPTKWKAVDYQPRTHWTEEVVIIPETTVDVVDGTASIETDFSYVAGNEYKITYNGTEYLCTAVDIGGVAAVGNTDLLLETGDNGMPFVSLWEYALGFVTLDGSESVTVSVVGPAVNTIPRKYIPEYVFTLGAGDFGSSSECNLNELPKALILAAYEGMPIYLLVTDENGRAVKMPASFSMAHLAEAVGELDNYADPIPASEVSLMTPYLYARGIVGGTIRDWLVRWAAD